MNKKKEIIHSLNQLIQGEYMSIEAFNIYISKVQDAKVKQIFQQVQNQHRENIKNLSHYIQELGGQPDENIGLKGSMAQMKINIQTSPKIAPSDYIKKSIEGMTKGITMIEKLLRGDLDQTSRKLVEKVLQKDRASIEQLKNLQ
ncbi:PA2169 family four-helix-bundle protein [Garciella nitratireducens]|uniref:PA2169 family four-helix-bundle protein n=1 Tax=Garciella nitratireducens TaxID=218205 RepID=UPI000DE9087B|nr:PA2169 family four-helix-bundle protein [Garciella nitratireducens]RBP35562.1 bacterioferritin [Garciella nitratireducens]